MKKFFTIAIIALSVNAFAQVPTNGLVGYWPFNGNANDLSGSGNHGTVHNATLTTDRFGNPNSAYQFVGNDNNTVSYIAAYHNNLPAGNTPRTISVWLTHDTYGVPSGSGNDGHPIIAYGTPATNSSNELLFFTTSGGVDKVRYGGFNNDLDMPFTYTLSTWYHLVATFDGTTASIYINNSLVGSGNYASWNTVLDSLVIGSQTPRTRFHNGKIDDIRIYNRVLDSSEIASLFNESLCYQTITVTDTLIINVNLTGFNPISYQNSIKIFPNPTSDHITIDFGGNYSTMNGYTLKITNSLSQIVYTTTINTQTTTVNLSTWTGNGIYFVHLIDGTSNTIDIRKIVLQ
jgi:hypothetical protein